jgi:hypothetical protein
MVLHRAGITLCRHERLLYGLPPIKAMVSDDQIGRAASEFPLGAFTCTAKGQTQLTEMSRGTNGPDGSRLAAL